MNQESEIPYKMSLASQVANYLRKGIETEMWHDWLPPERILCQDLQISRSTLRVALKVLQKENLTEPVKAKGTRILAQGSKSKQASRQSVAIITPEILSGYRPHFLHWIDKLRELLMGNHIHARIFDGYPIFEGRNPARLKTFVKKNQQDCWLLHLTSHPLQRWFCENKIPCIVAGTPAKNVDLPHLDTNYKATALHLTGLLYSRGHRNVAFICSKKLGGERAFMKHLREGSSFHANDSICISTHETGVGKKKIALTIDRILSLEKRPTAIITSTSFECVTAISYLQNNGHRIPQDISVVSKNDDVFLDYVFPTPARYKIDPNLYAKEMMQLLMKKIRGGVIEKSQTLLVPDFVEGATIADLS